MAFKRSAVRSRLSPPKTMTHTTKCVSHCFIPQKSIRGQTPNPPNEARAIMHGPFLFPFRSYLNFWRCLMKQKFYAELSRRLREEGIESSYAGTQNLRVSLHGQPVLRVTPSSEIFILPAGSRNEEVNDLYHRVGATADEVYEYVEAVQGAHLLHASDLKEEFRLLADFGCAVLAGRERENDRGY